MVRDDEGPAIVGGADENGYVNRHGLSRKVSRPFRFGIDTSEADLHSSTSLRH